MIRNVDPKGPVPDPNARGEVVLVETRANYLGEVVIAFLVVCPVLFSAIYWGEDWSHGNALAFTNTNFILISKLGFLMLPALFLVLGDIVAPPRLCITDSGIALRQGGFTKTLQWGDLIEIKLQVVTMSQPRGGTFSSTFCHIIGRSQHFRLGSAFGVEPTLLARYLQTRGLSETGASISLNQTTGAVEYPRSPYVIMLRLVIVLGCGSLFVLIYTLLLVGILQSNQASIALWISSHFSRGN